MILSYYPQFIDSPASEPQLTIDLSPQGCCTRIPGGSAGAEEKEEEGRGRRRVRCRRHRPARGDGLRVPVIPGQPSVSPVTGKPKVVVGVYYYD